LKNKLIVKNKKSKIYYTLEELQLLVNKYETQQDFRNNNLREYKYSIKNNLLKLLFKNHQNEGKIKIGNKSKWSLEILQTEADKYKNRKEFRKNNSPAYYTACSKKILNKLFENHQNNGYLDKPEWKENIYVIYVYELPEFNRAYVGLTNNIKRRDNEHIFSIDESLNKFCKENNIPLPKYKILEDELKSTDAQAQEKYWLEYYINNNWNMFNIAKTGSLGCASIKWNKKSLQKLANSCKTRKEFSKNYGAYWTAQQKRMLDELFENHINKGFIDDYWTFDVLQSEANKYKTRQDFRNYNILAYKAAWYKKILDKLFENHLNEGYSEKQVRTGYWTIEKLQEEANKYQSRNEFKINNSKAYNASRGKMNFLFKDHKNNGYKNKQ